MRAALALFLLTLASSAQAAEANRCVVSVTPVQFGVYNPLWPSDVRSTGTITYNCSISRPISISLTRGPAGADFRHMGSGETALAYNLYLDAAATVVWGDGAAGTQIYRDPAPPPNVNVSVPIFAHVPPRQSGARTGPYADNLIVTINY